MVTPGGPCLLYSLHHTLPNIYNIHPKIDPGAQNPFHSFISISNGKDAPYADSLIGNGPSVTLHCPAMAITYNPRLVDQRARGS